MVAILLPPVDASLVEPAAASALDVSLAASAAAAVATFGLVVGAFFAWKGVGRQIRQAERQHREQMKQLDRQIQGLSLRPTLYAADFQRAPGNQSVGIPDQLAVVVRNLGVGPALKTKMKAWLMPIGPVRPGPGWDEWAREQRATRDQARPHFAGRGPSLEAGAQATAYLTATKDAPAAPAGDVAELILIDMSFEDDLGGELTSERTHYTGLPVYTLAE